MSKTSQVPSLGKTKVPSLQNSLISDDRTGGRQRKDSKAMRKHKLFSEGSMDCSTGESSGNVEDVIKDITLTYARISSQSKESDISKINIFDLQKSWRGWIVLNETKPIVLITPNEIHKEKRALGSSEVEKDILQKVIELSSVVGSEFSVGVLPVNNLKIKVKQYTLDDLAAYDSRVQQLSGASLFKGNETGLRRTNKPNREIYEEINLNYNLPEVFKEDGSQASSTELRIFKATVTLKKPPTCSLKRKSREKLFLMFSPSDDNVIDIMNNSQIKNKMLRHDIAKFLKPRKKESDKSSTSNLKNAPLYTKRQLPALVPVMELGNLKNLPLLTTDALYDLFFKENVIEKDGYSILVKEQPMLVENITLFVMPSKSSEKKSEIKDKGFVPRYTLKDREGEEITSSEKNNLETYLLMQQSTVQPSLRTALADEQASKQDISNSFIMKSVIENKISRTKELKDNIDEHLNHVNRYLRQTGETPSCIIPHAPIAIALSEEIEPEGTEPTSQILLSTSEPKIENVEPLPEKKGKSNWDKFELDAGAKARLAREQIELTLKEIKERSEAVSAAEKKSLQSDEVATRGSTIATDLSNFSHPESNVSLTAASAVKSAISQAVSVDAESQITPENDEDEISQVGRASLEKILQELKDNSVRLKKEIIEPVIKPVLPDFQSTSKKRFYLRDFQQYWSERHADATIYYHNPIQQFGHVCGKPVINDDRTVHMPTFHGTNEEVSPTKDGELENASLESKSSENAAMENASLEHSSLEHSSLKHTSLEHDSLENSSLKLSNKAASINSKQSRHQQSLLTDLPVITERDVDEIKHELGSPKFSYIDDKKQFAGLAPSTCYTNSKKELVTLNYCDRFLKTYKRHDKRRKLFLTIDNELGVQKVVSTTIKPTGLSFKELESWQAIAKFVADNVTYKPLEDPLYLPHLLSSPGLVLQRGHGNPFEMSTLLASLLIGQGYDAYVVSGYANVLLTLVESARNYLRYECSHLLSEAPTDPFESFNTVSHVAKMIEKANIPVKEISNYKPAVAPYLDSSYLRQVRIDEEKEKEEEAARIAEEDEQNACKRFLSMFEADEYEGQRIHSWVVVLPGYKNVESAFFIEPSSGLFYPPDDDHYYGIESIWNHLNYWIHRNYEPYKKKEETEEKAEEEEEKNNQQDGEEEKKEQEIKKSNAVDFDLTNDGVWLPLLINGPQIFKMKEEKGKKKELQLRIAKLEKNLDMPKSWCPRITITTNQVERRMRKTILLSYYKRAVCYEYQVGYNDDGLVAKVTRFSDLLRTDPEYEIQSFIRRRDRMYRRRREIISDKLTEFFSFGRDDCLKVYEFIDGADAMYCDHNIYFYWDYRDDGLKSVQMTDLYLKLEYGGRADNLNSIIVLYGANIEEGKKSKRKGAEPGESGKTPRKEIQTIVQEFSPSSTRTPWNDFARLTYRVTKGEIIVDFQYEVQRVTVTTKFIRKSHDDPELGQAVAEIARRKRDREDDEDALSELDLENYDKGLDVNSKGESSSDEANKLTSKTTNASLSDKKSKKLVKSKTSNFSIASPKKSTKEKDKESRKSKSVGKFSSEESVSKSTRSTVSEASFGLSDQECSSESERERPSFYPSKLVADKDKSLWACNKKNKTFLSNKFMTQTLLAELAKKRVEKNKTTNSANEHTPFSNTYVIDTLTTPNKISDFGHLTRDSSSESSNEDEEYLKELRKRQFKAINETKEVYKAIERDNANPNIASLIASGKVEKYKFCTLEQLQDRVNNAIADDKYIQNMKQKLDDTLLNKSFTFPNETISINFEKLKQEITVKCEDFDQLGDISNKNEAMLWQNDNESNVTDSLEKANTNTSPGKSKTLHHNKPKTEDEVKENSIDPLVVNIYKDTDRCLDDPLSLKKRQTKFKQPTLRSIFSLNTEVNDNATFQNNDSEMPSLNFKKVEEITLSEEEAANEKDIDSIEGQSYNSDDVYSLQSKNASSRECNSSDEDENDLNSSKSRSSFSCHSENSSVVEYQTEAPKHHPYDFQGFHFQAGKMYARKLYQLKEVCDNTAIDSDQQSEYEGDDDYDAEFLEGEINKFLENTVDKLPQELREARNLIGGLKKSSDTNVNVEPTGVYYCSLSDKYINYVDSYFRKINKKRELQSDKALMMEILKQRAKEPDKIIKHIREYISCRKNGTPIELDENLMNLITHVRPVELKKKDRLGYEILTDDDDDEMESVQQESEEEVAKPETVRESIEPVNITMMELMDRLGDSPNAVHLGDAVNNLKKFKDMETVNQLTGLPLHECFSDANIRNHLQSSKVNDGYFIDDNIDGTVRTNDECKIDLGFVTDPEHVLLSKDIESVVSSTSDSGNEEQETKLKHMEIMTKCGKETIKEAMFFEPIYTKDKQIFQDPFKPVKFRMFEPLEPGMLDSDSDGSISNKIMVKRRKALKPKVEVVEEIPSVQSLGAVSSVISEATVVHKRLEIDRTFGLQPIEADIDICRVGVRNMSVNDEVSSVDKSVSLDDFLTMEDETINYVRNIEAYINNLLIQRRKERQSTKRHILQMSRKGIRRANFKLLKQKLDEFNKLADILSFEWDFLEPYLHLLLPEDNEKKFTYNTSNYIMRCLIIDFIEREMFKLKSLYKTYEEARQNVVEMKNLYMSKLENLSFSEKINYEKLVMNFNEKLRKISDRAHVLRFVILRRAKAATKRFLKLIKEIKEDGRINEAYSEAKERIIMLDLAERWPQYFEFTHNFSGLPVASELNDFTTSYIPPLDDIIIRKILKQVRKKPPKYILCESTYDRYLDTMEREREYLDGFKKTEVRGRSRRSLHSIFLGERVELNIDGKNSDFIDKSELINDLEWQDFFYASDSDEEITQEPHHFTFTSNSSFGDKRRAFDICSKSLIEELIQIKEIESFMKLSKESSHHTLKKPSYLMVDLESEHEKRDAQFFENYGTPEVQKSIQSKLPEYFEYI